MKQYKSWLGITTVLGILFVLLQYFGFVQLWENGITLSRNVSFSFLYVIVAMHALHVLGGIVALIISFIKSFSAKRKTYSSMSIDLVSTYWHFGFC
jgi:cytochrome c oxidase subunit 3